jgi:hypothetical protein
VGSARRSARVSTRTTGDPSVLGAGRSGAVQQ